MLKIILADDHAIVREGLKHILMDTPDINVKGEASTDQELLNKVSNNNYDLVILDISLPGRNGIDLLKDLKRIKPNLPVLILSMFPEEQYAFRSLRAGASGYLTKESAPEELVNAIRKAVKGRKYISPSLVEKLALEITNNIRLLPQERLSNREYQVMCMIASGKRVTEIAESLSRSVKTISTHRARILKKMGMKNSAQLTYYAIKNKIVD